MENLQNDPHFQVHKQLTQDGEIRLLTLQHGVSADPIECDLHHTLIKHAGDYAALSYVWGDASQHGEIHLNGAAFRVTASVETALRHLRDETRDRVLWIDAICINQSLIAERNKQILLMQDIYSSASQVLIWLGPGNAATDIAVHALYKFSVHALDDEWELDCFDKILDICQDLASDDSTASADLATNLRQGLNDIFGQPWFDRTWIIQELAVASACPLLLCGDARICWDCFVVASRQLDRYIAKCNIADKTSDYWVMPKVRVASYAQKHFKLNQIRTIAQVVAELTSEGKEINSAYFVHILSATRYAQCTDPRDKIYGVLGLAKDAAAAITVDYSLSIQTVFQIATIYMLTHYGFAILASQGYWAYNDDCPSWVVDFRHPEALNWMPLVKMADSYGSKYCSLPMTKGDHIGSFQPNNIFRIHGLLLDEIAETAEVMKKVNDEGDRFRLYLSTGAFQVFVTAAKPCQNCSVQPSHCTHLQYAPKGFAASPFRSALLRTLVSDDIDPARSYAHITRPNPQDMENVEFIVRGLAESQEELASMNIFPATPPPGSLTDAVMASIAEKISKGLNLQRAFRTEKGWIGHAGPHARKGDVVVAVYGGDVPFVLRRAGEGRWRLVGACYVEGAMFGELARNPLVYERIDESGSGDITLSIALSSFDLC
ncbi:HET-domain-containing protein [Pyrenochaeta sp. DS3sAY3a]|nr:HET-domain-containing protein [Pyrenochaeta sp. DS3sAY3a]